MIAIDTSSLIAYLSGEKGPDVEAVDQALDQKQAVLPPVVFSEILSDPKLPKSVRDLIGEVPPLIITDGYWERAGLLRSKLVFRKLKAPLADTLIAQSCIDYGVLLITRDNDFRHFTGMGLKLFE
ncbi:MAG: PIN domain-containing protein [Deltaproteobacteria bacterium]|nr:PIN domain-containing protein [Deltaproteobacteria bacterium]MBI4373866.1 PIN domain-containing protein [Deltaproteobacteria bacterium]